MSSHFFYRHATFVYLSLGAGLLAACSSDDDPSPAAPADSSCTAANNCTFFAAGATEAQIQDQVATAKSGDTIKFGEGTFTFTNQLALPANASNVTVLGAGIDKTVLDFSQQSSANDSVFAQYVQNLRLEGFSVKDPKGNAIKVLKGTNVTFRNLKTYWTSEDGSTHGAYGIYPVQSTNVLVENSISIGASDTGIYVGQSQSIVVRNNEVYGNVAGIEIENCFGADVYKNNAHDNASGILVFDLPDLEQTGGHDILIHENNIHENNTENFSPSGLLTNVPAGTGFFVLANTNVEVFGNTFTNNNTAQTAILSYYVLGETIKDANYKQPFPTKVYIHNNTYSGGGAQVDTHKPLGLILTTANFPDKRVPDVIYDGILPPPAQGTEQPANPLQICLKDNAGASGFVNLHFDQLNDAKSNLAEIRVMNPPQSFDCELPAIAPVSFPGL